MSALFTKKSTIAKPTVAKPVPALTVGNSAAPMTKRLVLRAPRVTEKATMLSAHNTYVFEVDLSANKLEIAAAVRAQYNVHPTQVRIIRSQGKHVRWGKGDGKRAALKKAMVTLPKNEKLSLYEGV